MKKLGGVGRMRRGGGGGSWNRGWMLSWRVWWMVALGVVTISRASAQIRISEIYYQPVGTNLLEEWLELSNPGPSAVDLSGWKLSHGVRFTFPSRTALAAGSVLVVAADVSTFSVLHPEVGAVVGGWLGSLSDDGERIELVDASGRLVDAVDYAPDGAWATRRLAAPDFAGKRGWEWEAPHAGGGHTLERRRLLHDSHAPHNWTSSALPGGTPGRANSWSTEPLPPLISEVRHVPAVPRPFETTRISCRVVTDTGRPATVLLRWRVDGAAEFAEVPMRDDGKLADGLAGDGRYGAEVPAQAAGTVVEWSVWVIDELGNRRIYPEVASDVAERTGNPVYQVEDPSAAEAAQPVFRIVLPRVEREYLETEIWGRRPDSDAAVNGTWISRDGETSDSGGWHVRYLCGIRNRGHGTRNFSPHNIHVGFRNDHPWKDRTSVNLNAYQVASQHLGSAVFRWLGIPMAPSASVQVRINGENLARPGPEQYGSYAFNEPINDRLTRLLFPDDAEGNLYRGVRDMLPGIRADADLKWLGASHTNYTNAYAKENHTDRQDWSDLVRLIDVLNHAPEATYLESVRAVIDVEQWVRYFAVSTLLGNQENSLANGAGDDFVLYRGVVDPRFKVLPYDMDSLLGRGSRTNSYQDGIWRMTNVPAMHRFITHPGVAPLYLRSLRELATNAFAPERLGPRLDQWLGAYVDAQAIDSMKRFATNQVAHVLSRFPHALHVEHGLIFTNGMLRASSSVLRLSGEADPSRTWSVTVQGQPANWSPVRGVWEAAALMLSEGVQRIRVTALGEQGEKIEEQMLDVFLGTLPTVPGPSVVNSDVQWTAAEGPRFLASTLTVSGTATLRIGAGTSVYLGAGADLVVEPAARLVVDGTEAAPVRFSRAPGSASAWGGILIQGAAASPETEIRHALFEGNADVAVHVDGGSAWLEGLRFRTTDRQYVSLDAASFVVMDCEFPSATAAFELVHGSGGVRPGGRGIFLRNYFGATIGYNDVIDFTGGNRPSPALLHILDNVFMGSSDDHLDLDGTDAWVEGNLFLHVHRNGSPDSASAVSGGNNGRDTSEVTVVGNVFFDVDQAATAKQGNFYVLLNNTIVRQTKVGGVDTDAGVVNFADDGTTEGAGMMLVRNVIHDIEKPTRNQGSSRVAWIGNLLPPEYAELGEGTVTSAPRFVHLPTLEETRAFRSWSEAQVMWEWLALAPGSGGRGEAPGGADLGAARGSGLHLGMPREPVRAGTKLRFQPIPLVRGSDLLPAEFVEGAGYTQWRYAVDGGPWSDARSTSEPLLLAALDPGSHEIAVVGRRDTGHWQDDGEFTAVGLGPTRYTWVTEAGGSGPRLSLRISEVRAYGVTMSSLADGLDADWVEIENFGDVEVDLSGVGLTDREAVPHRFKFPAGVRLAAGARRVVGFSTPGFALGFGLRREGGEVRLSAPATDGGAVLDQVVYGAQLAAYSIGRAADGTWMLGTPTPGAANRSVAVAGVSSIRINEWLASAQFSGLADFVELFNRARLPVDAGGLRLSDAPGSLVRQVISPLTFIEARSSLVLSGAGAEVSEGSALGFGLSSDGGSIHLSDRSGAMVDVVVYGPQRTDIAEGRTPDGGEVFSAFPAPTPGAPNPAGHTEDCTVERREVMLLPWSSTWRYQETQNLDGELWTAPEYDDSTWPSGPALLAVEDCDCLPAPGIGTPLRLGRMTYYFRAAIEVPTRLVGYRLLVSTVLDDGMVMSIDGRRVLTVGMDTDTPAYADDSSRNVGNGAVERFTVPLDELAAGPHVVAVEVHQANSTSSDVVFGLELVAQRSETNCVPAAGMAVRLNEVLAAPVQPGEDGPAQNFVELINLGVERAALEGWSITDDPAVPHKWVIPAGTLLEPGQRWMVTCDAALSPSTTNTGFGLRAGGGAVHLHDRVDRGGGLIDAVRYGIQVSGMSLSRVPEGTGDWALAEATPGATNRGVALGSAGQLRINEWLADASTGGDWFELWNGGELPVALGGLGLTDAPSETGAERMAPRSYIGTGARGFVQIHADGAVAAGADHVSFALRKAGEGLGLVAEGDLLLDAVIFDGQVTDQSEGRFPDGAETRRRFTTPTPARPNLWVLDEDRDGLPDDWERVHFGDLSAAALSDADRDGLVNLGEYLAGTDPRDAASRWALSVVRDEAGILLRWPAIPGRLYEVQVLTRWGEPDWAKLTELRGSGVLQVMDPIGGESASRFYRVVVKPSP